MNIQTVLSDGTYVLVADGAGGTLYAACVKGEEVNLTQLDTMAPENLDAEGPSGSRPPEQTARQTDEATFAKQVANRINQLARLRRFDDLVVLADPQTLGQMRAVFDAEARQRIVGELPKTLTNASDAGIADAVRCG